MPKVALGKLLPCHGLYCHLVAMQDTTGEAVGIVGLGLPRDNPSCMFLAQKPILRFEQHFCGPTVLGW